MPTGDQPFWKLIPPEYDTLCASGFLAGKIKTEAYIEIFFLVLLNQEALILLSE